MEKTREAEYTIIVLLDENGKYCAAVMRDMDMVAEGPPNSNVCDAVEALAKSTAEMLSACGRTPWNDRNSYGDAHGTRIKRYGTQGEAGAEG